MGGPTWNFGGGLTYPCHGTGDLSILCIENDKLRLIDFDDTIDEFTAIGKLEGRCFDNNYPYRN